MQQALRNTGKTELVSSTIRSCSSFVYRKDPNLHHGRFLFRHKGKKRKGKPNYPPTKLLVKAHRHMRRKLPDEMKVSWPQERRESRRAWTRAIVAHNDSLRPQRVRKRALGQRVPARLQALGIR